MKVTAYQITQQRSLEELEPDQVFVKPLPDGALYWVDVEQPDFESLQRLLAPLNPHPLVLEICLGSATGSSIAPLPNSLVVRFPLLSHWEDPGEKAISVICVARYIVTVHDEPIEVLDKIAREFSEDRQLHEPTTHAILYQILDFVIDRDMELVLNIRRRVDQFEELVEQEGEPGLIHEVLAFKRRVVRFATFIEDQHRCANALQTLETKHFSIAGLREYMRDTISHSEHALRSVGRQESRLNELYQHYQLSLHDKADNRLRILTIISAVFMPLTLITGIYGMNFHKMPELGWPYAYPAVIGLMILLAAGMLWNFSRRGWFQ